jgi:asparagine synthase (glutamine-hydrolysing)
MCGIAGLCGDLFQPGVIGTMTAAVAHRGPDGDGVFESPAERVAVGQTRLAILDLTDAAAQPMRSACGRWVLTYNGEIYNFRELRAELEARGERFTSTGDTEVLLRGLMRMGRDFLPRLNGIFALGLWDEKERTLLLARDQLGIKPLYIATHRNGLAFASEIKALLAVPGLPREIDHLAIHNYLAHLWSAGSETPLRSVRKVEPGEALTVRDGSIKERWRYYELPYGQAPHTGTEEEIVEELRERLATAVRRQMVSDVPVGAFLSGGLDSSAVALFMRQAEPERHLRCYTIAFAGSATDGFADDLPYARRVAEILKADLTEIVIEPDVISRLPEMIFHLDEPQADPAAINALLISERARHDGYKVLMSGAGGDDVFSGYRRHRMVAVDKKMRLIPRPLRASLARLADTIGEGGLGGGLAAMPALRRAIKAATGIDNDGDRRLASYFLWGSEQMRRRLYAPAMTQAVEHADTARPFLEALQRIPDETDPLNRLLFLEKKFFLADHNLNYTDKTGMAAGVETRVPLLDIDLVAFAARIPSHMKQRGSVGKAIFKRAMEPYLPRDIIYRPKTGFGAPLRHWLKTDLAPLVDELLHSRRVRERGLFDQQALQRLVTLDRQGRVDAGYTIFSVLCIELWCRLFVDAVVPSVDRSFRTQPLSLAG